MSADMSNTTLYDVIRILNYGRKNKIERLVGPTVIQEIEDGWRIPY